MKKTDHGASGYSKHHTGSIMPHDPFKWFKDQTRLFHRDQRLKKASQELLKGTGGHKTKQKMPRLAWHRRDDNVERGKEMCEINVAAKARRAAKELGWWQNAPDGGDALGTISGSSRLSTPQLL